MKVEGGHIIGFKQGGVSGGQGREGGQGVRELGAYKKGSFR